MTTIFTILGGLSNHDIICYKMSHNRKLTRLQHYYKYQYKFGCWLDEEID